MKTRTINVEILQREIDSLPKGNISYKNIRGRQRMYLQWREDGKNMSTYVKKADEEAVSQMVNRRKELERQLTDYTIFLPQEEYHLNVRTGYELVPLCRSAAGLKQRDGMKHLKRFLYSEMAGKIFIVYGLRRTGKTTMLFQAAADLDPDETAYIKITSGDTMKDLNSDLRLLQNNGIHNVFIDEITLMDDFIDSASLISDVYAMAGMKIILSGTDSLGFAITADEELYDRAVMLHTTFIPFREYSRLLDIHDIDEYIRYGGTLRAGETNFDDDEFLDESIAFRDDESTRRYIDTAIARNIQHSLDCYEGGSHLVHLQNLRENGELTGAINRIIEDMNHRFVLSVLTRTFKSHDLGSSAQIERKRAALKGETSVLDEIDTETVTVRLMNILEIKDSKDYITDITNDHIIEIKEYLRLLDLITDYQIQGIDTTAAEDNVIFTQPGIRYAQAQALVHSLMKDEYFMTIPVTERNRISDTILQDVRGRMLEDIVLLETQKSKGRGYEIFKLIFPTGEFDMVICDLKNTTCEVFEIKHSDKIDSNQYRHLIDEEKCQKAEFRFGPITRKAVLYNGPAAAVDGIQYVNISEYLKTL